VALCVAHLDTEVLIVPLNRERGDEQLALLLGTLDRRIIVGEFDAILVTDKLGRDIPAEKIAWHGSLPDAQKNGRGSGQGCCGAPTLAVARSGGFLALATVEVLLDHAIILRLRTRAAPFQSPARSTKALLKCQLLDAADKYSLRRTRTPSRRSSHHGDCLAVMQTFAAGSVNAVYNRSTRFKRHTHEGQKGVRKSMTGAFVILHARPK
jgi:hypothetical protein